MKALFAIALVAFSLAAGVAASANAAEVGSTDWWREYDRTHSNG